MPEIELQKMRTHGQEWRKDLKAGDRIDCFVKCDEKSKQFGWMQGLIVSVNLDGDSLNVEFPESSCIYDGIVDRWSTNIMQFESKTKEDYEWRRQFLQNAVNLECEVHDKMSWNKATIFEVKK